MVPWIENFVADNAKYTYNLDSILIWEFNSSGISRIGELPNWGFAIQEFLNWGILEFGIPRLGNPHSRAHQRTTPPASVGGRLRCINGSRSCCFLKRSRIAATSLDAVLSSCEKMSALDASLPDRPIGGRVDSPR